MSQLEETLQLLDRRIEEASPYSSPTSYTQDEWIKLLLLRILRILVKEDQLSSAQLPRLQLLLQDEQALVEPPHSQSHPTTARHHQQLDKE